MNRVVQLVLCSATTTSGAHAFGSESVRGEITYAMVQYIYASIYHCVTVKECKQHARMLEDGFKVR